MKITIVRIILVILILLNFITIFSFSEQDGVKSGGLSRRVTLVILNVFGDYNEPLSEEQEVQVENVQHIIKEVQVVSHEVTSGSNELASVAEELQSTFQSQTEQISGISTNMINLSFFRCLFFVPAGS